MSLSKKEKSWCKIENVLKNDCCCCSIEVKRHFNSKGHIMAVGDAHVLPGFLTPVLTHISFQSQRLLFSHASAEVKGEKSPERNLASTGSRNHKPPGHESDTLTTVPPGRG